MFAQPAIGPNGVLVPGPQFVGNSADTHRAFPEHRLLLTAPRPVSHSALCVVGGGGCGSGGGGGGWWFGHINVSSAKTVSVRSSPLARCILWPQLLIKLYDDLNLYWTAEGTALVLGYSTTTQLAVLLAVFCFVFLALVLVASARRSGAMLRGTIPVLSYDDGPVAPRVSFLTDIEGNWEYYENFVERSEALSFQTGKLDGKPVLDDKGAADVTLADGWMFVHGGDTVDKGGLVGGSIRVVRTLCRLKRKYPKRVILLLGNRDLNKMRLTRELQDSSKYYARDQVANVAWPAPCVPLEKRVSPDMLLRKKLAKQLESLEDDVPIDAVSAVDTLSDRLRWIYKETMGADGEFERQWAEQALLENTSKEMLSEGRVAQSIIESLFAGGWMRELLELGQLGFIHKDALFVHGGLAGGPFGRGAATASTAMALSRGERIGSRMPGSGSRRSTCGKRHSSPIGLSSLSGTKQLQPIAFRRDQRVHS
eukprot:2189241-Prymnesium_polylepis.4